MKNKLIRILTISLLIGPFLAMTLNAEGKSKNTLNQLLKGENRSKTYFTINQISTPVINNGSTDREGGNSGLVYPKGGTKTAVFQSGFFFGGLQDGVKKIGGSMYDSGLLVGPINPDGTPNETDAQSIYRVRPDWQTGDLSAEAKVAAGLNEDDIRKIYEEDWNNWPAAFGAPYKDVDNDGTYNPAVDIPGYPGADQTIWFVANDADATTAGGFLNTVPLNVEIQTTIWGYNTNGPLGYMLFRRYRIINKSNSDIQDMYLAMWSDVDLGGAGDDLIGVDTELNLGFCYNGTAVDEQYGRTPPAVGFDFFQGPIVDGNADDVAIFDNQKIPGKKNLGLENFFFFINSEPTLADPQNVEEGYNLLKGLKPNGNPYVEFSTGQTTTHPYSGDPVAGTGDLDGNEFQPGDRRFGQSSGPFTFKVGDVQEIVVAEIVAGDVEGVDNIGAVGLLKFYDKFAQTAYDNFFNVPKAPAAPTVNATELDQEIVLNWDAADKNLVKIIETHNDGGYVFEGYNVYQLPEAVATKVGAKRVATFDLTNAKGKIKDDEFDPTQGVVNNKVVQFGNDGGIKRNIKIDKDLFDNADLYNGANYYFAVTAYAVNTNPDAVPRTLESEILPIHVVPHKENPGITYEAGYNDDLKFEHTQGNSDGSVSVKIIDPALLTGHDYEVSFYLLDNPVVKWNNITIKNDTIPAGTKVWKLVDKTTGETKLADMNDENPSDDDVSIDGMRISVSGAPSDFKSFTVTANASGAIDPIDAIATWAGWDAKNTSRDLDHFADDQQVGPQVWFLHTNSFADGREYDNTVSRWTNYTGGYGNNPGVHKLVPDDWEIRFTAAGSEAFWNWSDPLKVESVPFELWCIADPTDPNDDFKCVPFILDIDQVDGGAPNGVFGLVDQDHPISSADNDPYTDGIYWVVPKDRTPGTAGYDAVMAKIKSDLTHANKQLLWAYDDANFNSYPGMLRMSFVAWNGGTVGAGATYKQALPEEGTIFRIGTTKPNVAGSDVFTFKAPAVKNEVSKAKEDVNEINVFPNPYYGVNPEEVNKYQRYVTFSHLPQRATIRIFNLAGQPIRYIEKDSGSQFQQWNLTNEHDLPVASGVYIAYIDMPDLGKTKILKVAIIQEQQFLDRF